MKIKTLAKYMNDEGLVKVSLPEEDSHTIPQEILGLDDLDLNDLYSHLKHD